MSTVTSPAAQMQLFATLSQGSVSANVNPNPVFSLQASSVAGTFPVGSIDRVASISGLVTNGTPYVLNLTSGTDPLGSTLAMVHLLGISLINNSVTTAQVMTLGGGTHPWIASEQYTLQPGAGIVIINPNPGVAMVSGTNDQITIVVASGTNVSFTLTVFGRST